MDQLKRIADIMDGGDSKEGTVEETGYLERIANKLEKGGGGGGSSTQSDWTEDDTTDPAYIENKPNIVKGDTDTSIIEGQIVPGSTEIVGTIYITGDGNATTYTYTSEGTISQIGTNSYVFYCAASTAAAKKYQRLKSVSGNTLTFYKSFSSSALSASPVVIYRQVNKSTGIASHSEGRYTFATNNFTHAEGTQTIASGSSAHAEGTTTSALGNNSHSEGNETKAVEASSHAEGGNTIAASSYQHVQGKFNIEDANDIYADIVGNGTAVNNRHNAYTLDWNGNGVYAGKVTVGAAPTNDMDVATKKYVDDKKFIVTLSTQDGVTYTADKTFAEVKAAADADKDVVAKFAVPGNEYHTVIWLPMTFCNDAKITCSIYDATTIGTTPKGVLYIGEILSDNTTQFHKYYFDISSQP